ncbi:prepilin peptidase [Tahibacter amnicola]|uniref:Prepilin leader peptidase/N-methyltransferase n=1 Tax=Tahibacter amnicola TaxID=2976241 RepID=A0ABY6BD87_9GAMM|nr:A24 family peptidase [Tahibacter amnicola]UXI67704.1 A24 family peptidase [Tahibacter amnicola]
MGDLYLEGWPLLAVASLFGLIVGSFLNVVILRLPPRLMHEWRAQSREFLGLGTAPAEAQPSSEATTTPDPSASDNSPAPAETPPPDIVFVSSHCPVCKHALSPLDNIPLVSWLVLGGRCRYCKTPISIQYPLIEALSAFAAFVVVWQFGFTLQAAAALALTFCLIALAGIDFHTQLLPDNITVPLLWVGLLLSLIPVFATPSSAILGAVIGYLSLWSVYWAFKLLTGKEGMGYGDFKLLAALGAWLGPVSLLPIILISSLVGAILGMLILYFRGQDRSTPIPFGPFIAIAGWIYLVAGQRLTATFLQYGPTW